jgi:hypothetical protein
MHSHATILGYNKRYHSHAVSVNTRSDSFELLMLGESISRLRGNTQLFISRARQLHSSVYYIST